jgi:hypothetical protein
MLHLEGCGRHRSVVCNVVSQHFPGGNDLKHHKLDRRTPLRESNAGRFEHKASRTANHSTASLLCVSCRVIRPSAQDM